MNTETSKPAVEADLAEPIVLRPEDLARVAAAGATNAVVAVSGKINIMGGLRDPSIT